MRKTLSVLALLLSLLTVLSFSAFSVSAAESSEAESSVAESSEAVIESSDAESSEVASESAEDSESSEASEGSESAEDSESSETSESSEASEGSKDEASSDKNTSSITTDATNKNDTNKKAPVEEDEFPLALVVFLGALVILVVVCFICIKRENKFGNWLKKFFKDYKSELKKIVWASKDFTIKSTIVVIVCLLVCAGVIGLLDVGLNALILWLI